MAHYSIKSNEWYSYDNLTTYYSDLIDGKSLFSKINWNNTDYTITDPTIATLWSAVQQLGTDTDYVLDQIQTIVDTIAGADEGQLHTISEIINELNGIDSGTAADQWVTLVDCLAGLAVHYTQEECNAYNTEHSLTPADPAYLTPANIKSKTTVVDYVTTAVNALKTEVETDYATKAELTAFEDVVESTYVKKADLDTTLASYVKTNDLNSALASYVKTDTLQTQVNGYVNTILEQAAYIDQTELDTALSAYDTKINTLRTDVQTYYATKAELTSFEDTVNTTYVKHDDLQGQVTSYVEDMLDAAAYATAADLQALDKEVETYYATKAEVASELTYYYTKSEIDTTLQNNVNENNFESYLSSYVHNSTLTYINNIEYSSADQTLTFQTGTAQITYINQVNQVAN